MSHNAFEHLSHTEAYSTFPLKNNFSKPNEGTGKPKLIAAMFSRRFAEMAGFLGVWFRQTGTAAGNKT